MASAIGRLDAPARAASCSPTGPTGSPRANCRPRSRRARRASSATSSSRCGTGPTPRPICTTRSRPTSAIPRSTPTARSTARPEDSTDFFPVLDPKTQHGDRDQDAGARSQDADIEEQPHGAFALLGRRGDLGQPDQHAQSDDRRERPGLVHVPRRPVRQSGLLPQGLRPSFGEALPDRAVQAASSRCTIRRPARSR